MKNMEDKMKKYLITGLLLLVIVFAFAERKALVIANWNYPNAVLKSPKADADSIAAALEGVNFNITRLNNANLNSMKSAIDTLAAHLSSEDEVVFYFSGHGTNYKNVNYLVPAGVNLASQLTIDNNCYSLSALSNKLKNAKTSIIIVEASKIWGIPDGKATNPKTFVSMKSATPKQVIIFSSQPGKIVQNSNLTKSVFSMAMAKYIATSEVGLNEFFPVLSNEIMQKTGNAQKPWISGTLSNDFIFNTNLQKGMWKSPSPRPKIGGGSLSW
jgi:uncharacterized caspase-like protein